MMMKVIGHLNVIQDLCIEIDKLVDQVCIPTCIWVSIKMLSKHDWLMKFCPLKLNIWHFNVIQVQMLQVKLRPYITYNVFHKNFDFVFHGT